MQPRTPKFLSTGLCALALFAFAAVSWATPIDLGLAGKYTLLAEGKLATPSAPDDGTHTYGGIIKLGVEAHIFGSVGGRDSVKLSSGVIIDDDLDYGIGGYEQGAGATFGTANELSPAEWLEVVDDLQAASDAAVAYNGQDVDGQVKSAVYTSVLEPTTFSALGAPLSVYEIQNQIMLGSGQYLTIDGGPDDRFIINVMGQYLTTGGMSIGSDAGVKLTGGVHPCNVVFNFPHGGNGGPIASLAGSKFQGIYISPKMYWQIGDGAILDATKILADGIDGNLQDVIPPDCTGSPPPTSEPSPTPEPSPSPTPQPTPSPTPQPSPSPTPQPTPSPTPQPTPSPTPQPTPAPIGSPLGFGMHPDKSKMKFGRRADDLDYLLVQAGFTMEQWDPATCDFAVTITNANGTVTAFSADAGDLQGGGKCAIYSNRSARRDGGLQRLQICEMKQPHRWRFNVKGFDSFADAATLAEMSIMVDVCGTPLPPHTDDWRQRKRGWVLPRSTWTQP